MDNDREKTLLVEFMLTLGLGVSREYAEKRADAFLAARQPQGESRTVSGPYVCARCGHGVSAWFIGRDLVCNLCGDPQRSGQRPQPLNDWNKDVLPQAASDPTKCSRCDAVIGHHARKAAWSEARQTHEWLCLECARRETSHG